MILLLDLGNSRCKWAIYNDGECLNVYAIDYAFSEQLQRIEALIAALDLNAIQKIHIVSVLGDEFNQMFAAQISKLSDIPVKFYFSEKDANGIKLGYDDESTYGADRYCALVAAHNFIQGDKIVIDCGTATTIDVLTAKGEHLGGLIMPGVRLMMNTLTGAATGIQIDNKKQQMNLFAKNTQDAVYSGCYAQMQFGLHGIVDTILDEVSMQATANIVLTGGDCRILANKDFARVKASMRPHLVLEGLEILQRS